MVLRTKSRFCVHSVHNELSGVSGAIENVRGWMVTSGEHTVAQRDMFISSLCLWSRDNARKCLDITKMTESARITLRSEVKSTTVLKIVCWGDTTC